MRDFLTINRDATDFADSFNFMDKNIKIFCKTRQIFLMICQDLLLTHKQNYTSLRTKLIINDVFMNTTIILPKVSLSNKDV